MKKRIHKQLSLFAGLSLLLQTCWPTYTLALTSGPTQPEFSSFEQVNTTQMVDLFTGDFSYNLPLLQIPGPRGGYPLNLFYKSPTNMEDEASMVGLGWNIGVGAINRSMRGIPDDFNGENLSRQVNRKVNKTVGINFLANAEPLSFDFGKATGGLLTLGATATSMYNNYLGPGFSIGFNAGVQLGVSGQGLSAGFNGSFGTFEGINYATSVGLSRKFNRKDEPIGLSTGITLNHNTLTGLKSINFQADGFQFSKSVNGPSFLPAPSLPALRVAHAGVIKFGTELYTVGGLIGVGGFVTLDVLKDNDKIVKTPLFGSMYLGHGSNKKNAIVDYSRLRDKPLFKNLKSLPHPVMEEDYFSVNGHGMNGTFKLCRNEIGTLGDKFYDVHSGEGSFGVELALGSIVRVGGDLTLTHSESFNNYRKTAVAEEANLQFSQRQADSHYEPFYFDFLYNSSGQLFSSTDANVLTRDFRTWGLDDPLRIKIDKDKLKLTTTLVDKNNNPINYGNGKIQNRQARQKLIQYYTNKEILTDDGTSILPHFNPIIHKQINGQGAVSQDAIQRTNDDQLAAFTILDENGQRWHYGLPSKNHKQIEVAFSLGEEDEQNSCTKLVDDGYFSGNQIDYKQYSGENEEYYDKKEIPSYASAFQLTSIVSHDYIDTDLSDGLPNEKDYGYWIRFEYLQSNDKSTPFKWRHPYHGANFNGGQTSNPDDNKGYFTYGERDQFYPYRVYSGTHYAQFCYSQRSDGRGVSNFIQTASSPMGAYALQLDTIKLYRYHGTDANGNPVDPTHIKSVKFTYAASGLCSGAPNSANGKLKLEEVYTINYESSRGKQTPYKFEYNDLYGYDHFATDRWGVYQATPAGDACRNTYAPYTLQSGPDIENVQAMNVAAWHLTSIELPSGSKINIDVGRDHYAYVQNNRASQMLEIKGFGSDGSSSELPVRPYAGNDDDFKIHFNLNRPIADDVDAQLKLDEYFDDLFEEEVGKKQILFETFVDLDGNGNFERVEGMGTLNDYGFNSAVNNEYISAWLRFHPEEEYIRGDQYHPMHVSAWQYLKINRRNLLLPYQVLTSGDEEGVFAKMQTVAEDIIDQFQSFYARAINNEFAKSYAPEKSFIRLTHPDKKKFGGGVRTNRVWISDIWDSTEEPSPYYGNVYIYEEDESIGGQTRKVSTGVACNEPTIGGVETAFKHHERYTQQLKNASDDIYFDIYPINESYMQPARVGYSKVTVRSLASEYHYRKFTQEVIPNDFIAPGMDPGLDPAGISSTGQIVYEFNTAKDYPTVFNQTVIDQKSRSPVNDVLAFIGGVTIDDFVASQGFSVELNDMHGKPKSVINYSQKQSGDISLDGLASATYYEYHNKTESYYEGINQKSRKRLVNNVDLLVDDEYWLDANKADVRSGEMGVQREMFIDVRREGNASNNAGIAGQIHAFLAAILPISFPTFMPSITSYQSYLKTAVTNKVVRKSGIIENVITTDGQSSSTAQNLAFDPYTGEAVYQAVTDHFEQDQYQYAIPARYKYQRMGPANENWGISGTFTIPASTGGAPIAPPSDPVIEVDSCRALLRVYDDNQEGLANFFIQGDQFSCKRQSDGKNFILTYLYKLNDGNPFSNYFHVYPDYNDINSSEDEKYSYKLIRSGNRNLLLEKSFEISSLHTPLDSENTEDVQLLEFDCNLNQIAVSTFSQPVYRQVIDASAYIHEEFWHVLDNINGSNDFTNGNLGIFRLKRIDKPKKDRLYSTRVNQKGIIDTLYKYNWSAAQKFSFGGDWIVDQEITQYNKNGQVLESRDRFNIYTAALYGPIAKTDDSKTILGLPVAQFSNAQMIETAHGDFENHKHFGTQSANASRLNVVSNPSPVGTQHSIDLAYDVITGFSFPSRRIGSCEFVINKNQKASRTFSSAMLTNVQGSSIVVHDVPVLQSACVQGARLQTLLGTGCPLPCQANLAIEPIRVILQSQPADVKKSVDNATLKHSGAASIEVQSGSTVLDKISFSALELTPGNLYYSSLYVCSQLSLDGFNAYIVDENAPSGPRIATFEPILTTQASCRKYEVVFTAENDPSAIELTGNLSTYSIDDIRIHPVASNVQCSIYDFDRLRPTQQLDENNYLSLYRYDSDGNLIAIEKETEEGIFTIQEQRKYIIDEGN